MSLFPGKSTLNPQAHTVLDIEPAQSGIIFNGSLLTPKSHVKNNFSPVLVTKMEG